MANKLNSKKGISNSPFSEDWMPVKQIINGMIQLDSGEIVTGVKVHPKNIFIQDQNLQTATVNALQNFYNSFDYEFWLIVADRPVDLSLYFSQLQLMYNKVEDQFRKKLIMQDMNKINMFIGAEYSVVDTEYFILFKETRMDLIQKKLHNMMSGLANSGLNSTQTSNDDLRMIIDNFMDDGDGTFLRTVM